MESRLEKIFSMGINIMSLAVWLGEDRKCSAAVVGLNKFELSTFCNRIGTNDNVREQRI